MYVKVEVVQSRRLGQGSPRASRSFSMPSEGPAQARPDRRRGDLRQHRRRAGDGVRRARLSVRRADGRFVLDRAAQADARVRREGDPDAGRRARQRHGAHAPRSSRRSTAGSSRASSRIRPIPAYHRSTTGAGNPARLRRQAARLFRHRLGHRRHADRRRRDAASSRGRRCKIIATEPADASLLAGGNGSRTRSRAGRRTSCPSARPQGRRPRSSRSTKCWRATPRARWRSEEGIFCGIS